MIALEMQCSTKKRKCVTRQPQTWKNATITVATETVAEARRIARLWGEQAAGEPVTRTIFKWEAPSPDREVYLVDGVTVSPLWLLQTPADRQGFAKLSQSLQDTILYALAPAASIVGAALRPMPFLSSPLSDGRATVELRP